MYAFGDGLLFIAIFSVVALFPTGLAVFFLRPCRWFWTALSITSLAIAVTGVLAASVYILASYWALRGSPLEFCAALAVLRTLAAPLLAGVLMLSGVIAPNRTSRWALLAAAGIEGAVAAYAVLQWFAGCSFI